MRKAEKITTNFISWDFEKDYCRPHLFQSPHLVETQRRVMHDGMSLLSSQFLCAKYGDFKKSYLALPTDRMPAKTSVLKHYVILMHSRFYFDH